MAWCLSFHAAYRCRHAGACCRAEWEIPFADGTVAARAGDGSCTFFEGRTKLCAIHRDAGHGALPLTCQMFPRRVLHDARGTFISLSHFCPTAAALLFEEECETAIVEAPPPLTFGGRDLMLDGLDAREVWPPLLRPGMLMDADSYGAWERRAIERLTRTPGSPQAALTALENGTSRVVDWAPGEERLADRIDTALGTPQGLDRRPADVTERAVKRWLAARLFGAWVAYQADGLEATLRYLRTCLDTFTRELAADGDPREAIRRSDLLVLHRP